MEVCDSADIEVLHDVGRFETPQMEERLDIVESADVCLASVTSECFLGGNVGGARVSCVCAGTFATSVGGWRSGKFPTGCPSCGEAVMLVNCDI